MGSLYTVPLIILILIGVLWGIAFRVGWRWCRRCGVTHRADLVALACIFPTASLVAAAHLPALLSLFTDHGWLTPGAVAIVLACLVLAGHGFVKSLPEAGPPPVNPTAAASPAGARTAGARILSRTPLGACLIPVVIVAGTYFVFIIEAFTRFPTGHDSLFCHLPQAVTWMQQRAIHLVNGFVTHSVPENGMIVPCLLAFAKLEFLFTVVHLPKAMVCGLVVYALSRRLGASHRAAVLGVCVALSIPIVLFQSVSDYIDLYAAASWLSALLALTWVTRAPPGRRRMGLVLLAGLSAGVALGSKTTFVALVLLLGVVVFAAEWIHGIGQERRDQGTEGPRDQGTKWRPVRAVALFACASLVCSGFWFVRGAVDAGNPFYPMAVEIGGKQLLPGVTASDLFPGGPSWSPKVLLRWAGYPWHERKYGLGYVYGVDNGLGAAFAAVVPLGLAAAFFPGFFRRRCEKGFSHQRATNAWRLVFLLMILCGGALLVTVYCQVLRYVLPIVLVAVAVATLMIDRLLTAFPRATVALMSTALMVTAAVATFKPVHAFLGRVRHDVWARSEFYQIPQVIDELPPGTRILSLARGPDKYALLGRHLSNEVIIPEHWALLTGGASLSNRALRDHAIDYIFTRGPDADDWSAGVDVERVFDGTVDQPSWISPKARLYRVGGLTIKVQGQRSKVESPRSLPSDL